MKPLPQSLLIFLVVAMVAGALLLATVLNSGWPARAGAILLILLSTSLAFRFRRD